MLSSIHAGADKIAPVAPLSDSHANNPLNGDVSFLSGSDPPRRGDPLGLIMAIF